MHENQLAAETKAAQFIARCRRGFESPQHWRNWKRKHEPEIDALPTHLRDAVLLAYENSTHVEFSK